MERAAWFLPLLSSLLSTVPNPAVKGPVVGEEKTSSWYHYCSVCVTQARESSLPLQADWAGLVLKD